MDDFAQGLIGDVTKATEKWRKQREREIRETAARGRRRDTFVRVRQVTIQDAAWEIMETAYLKASGGGTLPVQPRQIMYAARGHIQDRTGRKLDDRYFTQTLLPDYVELTEVDWDIVWNARGGLHEPHTNRHVPLGTLEVREYLAGQDSRYLPPAQTGGSWHTQGARDRYGAVLFVEKEGFLPLFRAVKLAERYDLALMSSKGVSTTAARTLIDAQVQAGVPVFCVRDFDLAGFTIAGTLGRDTRRYTWTSKGAVDLGLRLEDVTAYRLESEEVFYTGPNRQHLRQTDDIRRKIWAPLRENGATKAEIEFLLHRRVELNAFASDRLVEWIEGKLAEHGVEKVVPDEDTLAAAARGFARDLIAQRHLAGLSEQIAREVDSIPFGELRATVAKDLRGNPQVAWDDALQDRIAAKLRETRA